MKKIAVFGFGSIGQQLASLFSAAGKSVIVCTRSATSGTNQYQHASFLEGAQQADAIALAIPYSIAKEVLASVSIPLAGKTVIDCTNPLNDDWSPLLLGQETSAAEELAAAVPKSNVVKAFNTIFADVMSAEYFARHPQLMTAFIASDDAASKTAVMELAEAIGLAPLDVGPLSTSRYLEAMAHLNIQIAVGQGGGTQAAFYYSQL